MNLQLNVATAFLAGLVSFVSPCVLPLIPAYLSFLTGSSLEELKAEQDAAQRARVIGHALAFICGLHGRLHAAGLHRRRDRQRAARRTATSIARVGGVVVVILGLNMIGVFKIPFLMMDKRPQWRSANRSLRGVVHRRLGLRGRLVAVHRADPGRASWLWRRSRATASRPACCFVYSLGLAVPFLLTAAAISRALGALNRIKRYLGAIEIDRRRVSGRHRHRAPHRHVHAHRRLVLPVRDPAEPMILWIVAAGRLRSSIAGRSRWSPRTSSRAKARSSCRISCGGRTCRTRTARSACSDRSRGC